MRDIDFQGYWAVEGGILGRNGALIELRYLRNDERTTETLNQLDVLIEELIGLKPSEVLSSPKLISQIWRMPEWILIRHASWSRNGVGEDKLDRLRDIRSRIGHEVQRLLGSPTIGLEA